jgi:dolichyl-phosphate-mannose-protein mannosyltransferase
MDRASVRESQLPSPAAIRVAASLLAAAVVPALVLVTAAVLRFADGDEGDYAAAAGLVVDGRLPYHDFLYTQTPVLPYVYGVWGLLTGETWLGLRALSVLFSLALALLLYEHLRGRVGRAWALVGVGLLSSSTLFFTWYPTVKTYALSTLLLFGAYVLIEGTERPSVRAAAGAGALAALSVQTRSLLLGGALVLAWAAWRHTALRTYALGFAAGLTPSIVFFVLDADRFLFGNVWYHGARSQGGLVGDFEQKAKVVANLVGIPTDSRPLPQFFVLLVSVVISASVLRAARGRVPLALLTAGGLALVALLPTPTYTQYFATTVPFLVVGVVELADYAREQLDSTLARAIGATALVAYLLFAPVDFRRLVVSSTEDRPGEIQQVGNYISAHITPGDVVVASWTGYLYGTGARPLPGLENAFAPHEAAALSPDDARRYHVASAADVERAIRDRRTKLVVVKVWTDLGPIPDYERAAREGGYRLAATVNTVRIYALPD